MYAIVDIETTGGSANFHRITEIAVVIHDGYKEIDRYETLINPERYIPANITALTGITNEMVEDAPTFEHVAAQIDEITKDKIFVAHNASFDYSFIKTEFQRLGLAFNRKKLCTVRLSRKIMPGIPSYSLGNLCNHLQIPIFNRHRAAGDAEATGKLLALLVVNDNEKFIEFSLKKNSGESVLPPNVPKAQFDKLPSSQGIYYFHDKNGKVVYVGKANNIRKRVSHHFSGTTHTKHRWEFLNSIYSVSHEICGNELIALLLENEEIKKFWPRYNRSYKSVTLNCGIYNYEDQAGYKRFVISPTGKRDKPCITFKNVSEATSFLISKVKAYNLCLRLCGIIEPGQTCTPDGNGWHCSVCETRITPEVYNTKYDLAYSSFRESANTYVVYGKGRSSEEASVVVVENGKYLGFGYLPMEEQITSFNSLKNYLKGCYDNVDVQNIINGVIKKCTKIVSDNFVLYKI